MHRERRAQPALLPHETDCPLLFESGSAGACAASISDSDVPAADRIAGLDGYRVRFDAPFFREFVVQTDYDVGKVLKHCRDQGILAGVALGRWFDDLSDCFMVAVTEKRSRGQIDALVEALRTV